MQSENQNNPFLLLCNLDKKSRDRSGGLPAFQSEDNGWTGVLFQVRSNELLASMSEVREIVPLATLTAVPATTSWLLGVMNLRGNLLPVVDLEGFLYGVNLNTAESRCRLLIVEHMGSQVGLLVRVVLGMKHYRKDDITVELPALDDEISDYVKSGYERQTMHHALFNLQDLLIDERFQSVAEK